MMIPYNNGLYPFFYPFLPPNCDKPPTLYSVLNSIVNGEKEEEDYTKIKDLAKEGRNIIFNFEYPLTEHITKEKFETMILNHFLMRRIGFETVTAFRIQLDVKLNEIMPLYNKMFDSLENWNIFNDGEITTRTGTDNKTSANTSNKTSSNTDNKTTSNTNSITNNTSTTTSTSDISDRRYSDTPQNKLDNVRDGKYVTNYSYDTNTSSGTNTGTSSSNGSSNGTESNITNGTESNTTNGTDNTVYQETITRTPSDKISILKEIQENIKSIYTLIFDELDSLFYQLI